MLETIPFASELLGLTWPEDLLKSARVKGSAWRSYAKKGPTRKAPHGYIETQLLGDWMRGVVPKLVVLLETYRVLIYSGAYDVILGAPLTEQALRGIEWSGQKEFLSAKKATWTVKGAKPDLAGYVRTVGGFSQVVVRGAGHMVPATRPAQALEVLRKYLSGEW